MGPRGRGVDVSRGGAPVPLRRGRGAASTRSRQGTHRSTRPYVRSPPERDPIAASRDEARANRKARLDELAAFIKDRVSDVVGAFWDIGRALGEVRLEQLWRAGRHTSFEDFLAAHSLPSLAQAAKFIAIARTTTRATPEADSPADFGDGQRAFAGKTAAEASVREIAAATRAAVARNDAARPKAKAALARERADAALRRSMTKPLKAGGLDGATVTVTAKGVRAEWPRERVEG